jgi:hypothetical protein
MLLLGKIKEIIGGVAPTIAAGLGGPVAGLAVQTICKVFGLDPKSANIDEQIEQALRYMTPEIALQLKRADQEFAVQMKELGVDVFRLVVKDKRNARSLYRDAKYPQNFFAFLILCGCAWVVYWILSGMVPTVVDNTLVGAILGYAVAEFKNVTGFYFGSAAEGNGVGSVPFSQREDR